MNGYRVAPPRTTSIENFLDLETIMSSKDLKPTGISSVEGYPAPPHVNSNFEEQVTTENYERDQAMRPVQNKIRSTNPLQLQTAINGGMPPVREMYMDSPPEQGLQLGPVARQNLGMVPPVRERYIEAPKPSTYPQHPALPQNSAQYSHYRLEGYEPTAATQAPSCLEIAQHIQKCPLCSKFYDNDRSMYWAAIVLLALACLYLLKQVLHQGIKK